MDVGDRVEVTGNSVPITGGDSAVIGRRGRVEMILDDGLVLVRFRERGPDGATLSFWPAELKRLPVRRV